MSEQPIASQSDPAANDGSESHPHRAGLLVFCPHHIVESVTEVSPTHLHARGIRGVILDLDNTIVRWHQEEIDDATIAWLELLKKHNMPLCILSNSVLSKRSERIAGRLGCSFVRQANKPGKQGFLKAMAAMGTHPGSTAIVGDQMFTDILGGNRLGIYTVMVRPLHKHEFPYTRYVSRPPEKLLLRWFKKRGHLP